MKFLKKLRLPDYLTLSRLIISPILLPVLIVSILPFNYLILNLFVSFVFFLFGLTDFFDGYFARKYYGATNLGKILDHVADKFLIFSSLIALVSINKINYFIVIILIGREFAIMTLRLISFQYYNSDLTVSLYGKLKTLIQIIFLIVVIANPMQKSLLFYSSWNILEIILLILSMFLSLFSLFTIYPFCQPLIFFEFLFNEMESFLL
jgi:CDP-diacylglycerol--glycerol-3-phosphate 3-phosphatidyltransferase